MTRFFGHRSCPWRARSALAALCASAQIACCAPGLAICALHAAEQVAPAQIPYCAQQNRIDADPGEWRQPWYEASFTEPGGPPGAANTVSVRSCWSLDALQFAVAITDADLISAPGQLALDQYHQYDSIQIYIDSRADAGKQMNDDDVDLLLLPDGRLGVLRGDALIGALASASVPQRAAAPLPAEYSAQRTGAGWRFELAIPLSALGLEPRSGTALGVDVASNDWLTDHPPGQSEALTPERVRALASRPAAMADTDPAVGVQILPRNWAGDDDFGYPQRWRRMALTGAPGYWERLVRHSGPGMALTWVGLIGLSLGLCGAGLAHLWYRRRLRLLLLRVADVKPGVLPPVSPMPSAAMPPDPQGDSPAAPEPAPDSAAETSAEAADDAATASARDREFAERVLGHIRSDLQAAHAPADLALKFHVSLRTLQRRLKLGLGSTPQDLVLAARLQAARELLRSGRFRVSEVADQVGFSDLSHFSRRYRQAYGHAPSAEA